jgi:hypothetical protein
MKKNAVQRAMSLLAAEFRHLAGQVTHEVHEE